jgi:hypothetical protein
MIVVLVTLKRLDPVWFCDSRGEYCSGGSEDVDDIDNVNLADIRIITWFE